MTTNLIQKLTLAFAFAAVLTVFAPAKASADDRPRISGTVQVQFGGPDQVIVERDRPRREDDCDHDHSYRPVRDRRVTYVTYVSRPAPRWHKHKHGHGHGWGRR